jgi:hypothetical protein
MTTKDTNKSSAILLAYRPNERQGHFAIARVQVEITAQNILDVLNTNVVNEFCTSI